MSEQAQRMEDIMNKKEKRRCTATNSLHNQISNSIQFTNTNYNTKWYNKYNYSTVITSTLSSTNTRKSHGVSTTNTITKSIK